MPHVGQARKVHMGPKEADAVARKYVFFLFADEGIDRAGREEIKKKAVAGR